MKRGRRGEKVKGEEKWEEMKGKRRKNGEGNCRRDVGRWGRKNQG